MRFLITTFVLAFLSLTAQAEDQIQGETLVRSLKAGQVSFVQFSNPSGDNAETLVYCHGSPEEAKASLANVKMGGVMLLPGAKVVFKNYPTAVAVDGTKIDSKFVQYECGGK